MLSLFILVPLLALILLNLPLLTRGAAARTFGFALLLALTLLQVVIVLFAPGAFAQGGPFANVFVLNLAADNLSRVLLLSIGIVVFAALVVGQRMIADDRKQSNFVNVLLIALIGMNGTVLLTDLFSLYVFLEITSIASFILIASNRDSAGLEGAFKYLMLSAVATVLMLSGVALLLIVTGGTSFEIVKKELATGGNRFLAQAGIGAFLCGLFIKGGLVPFHGWLPDAYSAAPAPVSIFLAGIATKVGGIYALIRVATTVLTPSVAVSEGLLAVGALSIVVGAVAALTQGEIKRLLAYSSISQVGYIILGLGCWAAVEARGANTPALQAVRDLALVGAILHLFNHAIFKGLLFVNSAAVEAQTGTTEMAQLGGLGGRMPVTGFTSTVAALSTAGIPPLAGFWSKLMIILALWQAHLYPYSLLAAGLSVVTLGYMLAMQRKVFFGKVREDLAAVREAGLGLVLPEMVLAAVTIGVGVLFPFVLNTFLAPIRGIL